MFSKILRITTPLILIAIIFIIAYNTYQETQDSTNSPVSAIPTNASVILKLNNLSSLNNHLIKHNIWRNLNKINQINILNKKIKKISDLFSVNQEKIGSNTLFISFHKVSNNKGAALFITNIKSELNNSQIARLFDAKATSSVYDNQTIYFSNSLESYFSISEDVLFWSNNKMLVTDAIRTKKSDDNLFMNSLFLDSYNTISNRVDINLMINYDKLFDLSNVFRNTQSDISQFSEWTATDLKISNNVIIASGLSVFNNSINTFTDIFKNQKAQDLEILEIIPENTTRLLAISFNNQKKIYKQKNKLLQNNNEFWSWDKNRQKTEEDFNLNYNEFINEIDNQAGIFNTSSNLSSSNAYTYFNTKESIRSASLLQSMIISYSNYKDFRINKIIDNKLVSNLFGDFFKTNNPFFITINDYFIFGNSEVALEYIIDNYNAKNILSENKSFKNLNSYISEEANIFFYLNPGKTAETLNNSLINNESFLNNTDSINKFTAFSIQMNTTKVGTFHNLCLFYDENYKESIKEEWYYSLDTNFNTPPCFIDNHFTNEKMILIQDNLNKLIALNSRGEKVWEKQIGNKILGEINFIDAYKNNKFQALFNTSNQLYLIDRNGNFVDGFPKNLPIITSMGHSLFDYNKNKKYRILIVGNDNIIYNLDKKGKKVNGWKYVKTNNNINQPPSHFVVNDKDYILESTNNTTTRLLALNGSARVLFEGAESFTSLVNITKEGDLYAITNENKLWTANIDGKTKIIDLPELIQNEKLLIYNDSYYISNDNSLICIKDSDKRVIDFDSRIQEINLSEGYITVTTNTSLYLIKDNIIVKGFPIESDGLFSISDIDYNGKTNLVNIRNKSLFNYEIIED